jgi:hypothetical protein
MTLSWILVTATNIYLVSFVFTSRPISLPASNRASVFFLYGINISTQYFNTISINQELICYMQFQSLLIFLDLTDGVL